MRDYLVQLVLDGVKTATSTLVAEYVGEVDPIDRVGDRWIVVDTAGRRLAVAETTESRITTIALVDDDFARAEGEGYTSKEEWRQAHEAFWNSYVQDIRRLLRDPTFEINGATLIVAEQFRVVSQFDVDD